MKKLTKSKSKMICGVCGGIAEYFAIDPTIVRILTLILGISAGTGIIIYILAAIIMPDSLPNEENIRNANETSSSDADFESHFKK
ncbi:MAG: PspC domain-containing protein [Spirochaetaceae bacterium]|nr:PspC domain-containing protein [Spirochaetaceae bacterium]